MNHQPLFKAFLDSLKEPFLFVDTAHVIRYMNKAAIAHYEKGEALLGTSIFDCHNEKSNATIREVFEAMLAGEEERLITDNEKHRIYMRAVRDGDGNLLGYYERYEPPKPERQRSGEAEDQRDGTPRSCRNRLHPLQGHF